MKGLSLKSLEAIQESISNIFRKISLEFLGNIPTSKSKTKTIDFSGQNLGHLFIQSLGTKTPTKTEEEAFKSILTIAGNYIDALENKTKARVTNSLNSYLSDVKSKDDNIKMEEVREILNKEIEVAGNHLKMIVNSESSKASNIATAMKISKVADSQGIEDPVVFFVVTIDDVTGPEEFRLHLMPDRMTPRCWRLSELSSDYHKKGNPKPSIIGLHPWCRCKITYLAPGYGFVDGKVTYKGENWDELGHQRKTK